MAQDAISFIGALGLDKVDLLGFSLGGFVAQVIALEQPDLVRKIIIAGRAPLAATIFRIWARSCRMPSPRLAPPASIQSTFCSFSDKQRPSRRQ